MKKISKHTKCMNTEYVDQYRAIMDIDNPYTCNFGKMNERTRTSAFSKLQNKLNGEYFDKK